jgi:Fe(II)/alpha-ketoglutarate-dependent arginine beta-hydroxylase
MFFMACASLLGDVFAWSTQQAGHIMHDVMPIQGHENEQLGSGSEERLWWHTEDAFSPFRGDYVGLMCLRNPDQVATTVASAEDIAWQDQDLDTLFSENYHVRPDKSHLPKNRDATSSETEAEAALFALAYDRIMDMCDNPKKRPILSGSRTSPYICLDPYYMDLAELDERPQRALDNLISAVDAALVPLTLTPGDCCFIDNFKTVHGRNSFKARFDGNDRWLKRLNITRNLRTSREARLSGGARVIY